MRHFEIAASVLLLAGATSSLGSVDSGLLAMVPEDSKFIGGVDAVSLRDSEFGKYLLAKAHSHDPQFQELMTLAGFDPGRDLLAVLIAKGSGSAEAVILARGKFDQSRIKTAAITKFGASIVTYGGIDLFGQQGDDDSLHMAIAFLDTDVMAMADFKTLQHLIDNRGLPAILNADLKSKIASIGNSNDIWLVSLDGGGVLSGVTVGPDGGDESRTLPDIMQSSAGLKLGSTIQATIDADTQSAKDAQSLADGIGFMATIAHTRQDENPQLAMFVKALDGMSIQNTGTSVHVELSMTERTLEQLAELVGH